MATEAPFNPVTQLTDLLGPKPSHPWAALIPQILIWCFRRFCVQKLMDISGVSLTEQVWEDHNELLYQYAPRGLETLSQDWFTPENIEYLHSSVSDYNRFFLDCLDEIDSALLSGDEYAQEKMCQFLDEDVPLALHDWLGKEFSDFYIFPCTEEDDDEFKPPQFQKLIRSLLEYTRLHPTPLEQPPPVQEQPPVEEAPAASAEEYILPPEPVEQPQEAPPPAPAPMAAALDYRKRTLTNHRPDRSTRGKTRRLPRAL